MTYYRDLREYLKALEDGGRLQRVKREINKDTELQPLVRLQFRGLAEDKRKAFLFENVIDSTGRKYDIPVVTGALAGSSQIYAIGMMCEPGEISKKMTEAELHPIDPRLVSSGPVQEEVHLGDKLLEHGGLAEFPIPIATPGYDAAPYITSACWVSKDPVTGVPNVGMYRAMVKSPVRTGVFWAMAIQGGFVHWRECQKRGIPLPAAMVIGGSPNISYVASSRVPVGINELAVAGGIAGEPVELVRCKTVCLEVPANAEIVIEGEVSTSELEPEAPVGEDMGFVGLREIMPYFNVKCITHRKKPICLTTISQYPPSETSKMRQYGMAATVYRHLRWEKNMSHVLEVAFYEPIGSSRLMIVKMAKTQPSEIWHSLEEAQKRFMSAKILVAVDQDVNIHDIDSVLLAICMRTQPHRDYRIVRLPAANLMDYSLEPVEEMAKRKQSTSHQMPDASVFLIDATMKWAYPPLSLPKKDFMDRALRIWQEEGLPELKLIDPWWGYNLGCWSRQDEELAEAAVKGDYHCAGKTYYQERQSV